MIFVVGGVGSLITFLLLMFLLRHWFIALIVVVGGLTGLYYLLERDESRRHAGLQFVDKNLVTTSNLAYNFPVAGSIEYRFSITNNGQQTVHFVTYTIFIRGCNGSVCGEAKDYSQTADVYAPPGQTSNIQFIEYAARKPERGIPRVDVSIDKVEAK